MQKTEYKYESSFILLISRYDDKIFVVEVKSNHYVRFTGTTYSDRTVLSSDKLADLYDTSSAILVFHHQVMKIIFTMSLNFI